MLDSHRMFKTFDVNPASGNTLFHYLTKRRRETKKFWAIHSVCKEDVCSWGLLLSFFPLSLLPHLSRSASMHFLFYSLYLYEEKVYDWEKFRRPSLAYKLVTRSFNFLSLDPSINILLLGPNAIRKPKERVPILNLLTTHPSHLEW